MTIDQLRQFVKASPLTPGIYLYRDPKGKVLYVGKAASLKRRLSSYLKPAEPRIQSIIEEAVRVTTHTTPSEIEALILESQYIKKYRPRYNVLMRDDKQYYYVAVTNHQFPRIYITHQPFDLTREETAEYLGPFTDGDAIKTTLRFLRGIFPYCTCAQKHYNFCLNYHIGKCVGYCCLREAPEETFQRQLYLRNIRAIRDILSGKRESLIKKLEKEMKSLGQKEDFEQAIELRDIIEKVRAVFDHANLIRRSPIAAESSQSGLSLAQLLDINNLFGRIEGYDVSNIQEHHATGAMVAFFRGRPSKQHYRKFRIQKVDKIGDTQRLEEVLSRRINHPEWPWPDFIVIDGGKGQVNTATAVLKERELYIPVVGLTKNDKHIGSHIYISTPGRSASRQLAERNSIPLKKLRAFDRNLLLKIDSEAHRFAIKYYRTLHKRTLTSPPISY